MKVDWIDAPFVVLRLQADTEGELDIIAALYHGPLAGAAAIFVREEESPWGRTLHGSKHHLGGSHLLVGLKWDIRNQPAIGRPRSHADVRLAQASQAAGQALHQLVAVIQRQAQADLGVAAAGVAPVDGHL